MSQDQAKKNKPCVCACEAEHKLTKADPTADGLKL
jgi:hypothetical protein